jgi:hypothetical protein
VDDLIRNLGPPVGVLLVCLFGWLDLRRMYREGQSSHDAAE